MTLRYPAIDNCRRSLCHRQHNNKKLTNSPHRIITAYRLTQHTTKLFRWWNLVEICVDKNGSLNILFLVWR